MTRAIQAQSIVAERAKVDAENWVANNPGYEDGSEVDHKFAAYCILIEACRGTSDVSPGMVAEISELYPEMAEEAARDWYEQKHDL